MCARATVGAKGDWIEGNGLTQRWRKQSPDKMQRWLEKAAAKPDQAAVQQRFRPRHDADLDAGPAVREQVKRGPPVSSRTIALIAAFPP